MSTWLPALGAVALMSSLSLVGAATMALRARTLERALVVLIAFAAGALLGDVFIHIVPEVAESATGFDTAASASVLGGIVAFFVLEKVFHWHHAHFPHEEVVHPVAISNIVGDALHNFVDGAIIAGAFLVSTQVGIATTVAVALHEIPQELGDFGILVHAGLKPRRALALNFGSGLAGVVGAIVTLLLRDTPGLEEFLLPFSAGAFVYIAGTDLIPELHKEPELRKSLLQGGALLLGIGIMALLVVVE